MADGWNKLVVEYDQSCKEDSEWWAFKKTTARSVVVYYCKGWIGRLWYALFGKDGWGVKSRWRESGLPYKSLRCVEYDEKDINTAFSKLGRCSNDRSFLLAVIKELNLDTEQLDAAVKTVRKKK